MIRPDSRSLEGSKPAESSTQEYRYAAFISYRHAPLDRRWAVWLHSALETYRVPRRLVTAGAPPRIGRVFRDEEEVAAVADLSNTIESALRQSKYLVVICSPRCASSAWVNREVEVFRELGRADQILAVLVEGEPHESFPPALCAMHQGPPHAKRPGDENRRIREPLAADGRPQPGERPRAIRRTVLLRLIATLIGVYFDDLRQREQERTLKRVIRIAAAALCLLGVVSWQLFATLRAERARTLSQLNRLEEAPVEAVPLLLDELGAYSRQVEPELRKRLSDPKTNRTERVRLQLYLVRQDSSHANSLFEAMLESPFPESILIRGELKQSHSALVPKARDAFLLRGEHPAIALRAASFLSLYAADNLDWLKGRETFLADALIEEMLARSDADVALQQAFTPIGSTLWPALARIYRDSSRVESERRKAIQLLLAYSASGTQLASLLLDAEGWQLPLIYNAVDNLQRAAIAEALREGVARSVGSQPSAEPVLTAGQIANAALTLVVWGDTQAARPLLTLHPDRSARSFFIDRYRAARLEPRTVVEWLENEGDDSVKAALVLILGTFDSEELTAPLRSRADRRLSAILSEFPSGPLWAAAAWTTAQWAPKTAGASAAAYVERLSSAPSSEKWRMAPNEHLMVVQHAGSLPVVPGRRLLVDMTMSDVSRPQEVTRPFAIAMFETSIRQYQEFDREWQPNTYFDSDDPHSPVYSISPQMAAEYCNWLSQQAGLPTSEWCYVTAPGNEAFLQSAPNFQERRGYRLPTETEWEFACRAGSATDWFFGGSDSLLPNYAHCPRSSPLGRKQPIGCKMPNDAGLFDIYGNADEICDDEPDRQYPIKPNGYFVTRGGAAGDLDCGGSLRGSFGINDPPQPGAIAVGFRICQTLFYDVAESTPHVTD